MAKNSKVKDVSRETKSKKRQNANVSRETLANHFLNQ